MSHHSNSDDNSHETDEPEVDVDEAQCRRLQQSTEALLHSMNSGMISFFIYICLKQSGNEYSVCFLFVCYRLKNCACCCFNFLSFSSNHSTYFYFNIILCCSFNHSYSIECDDFQSYFLNNLIIIFLLFFKKNEIF